MNRFNVYTHCAACDSILSDRQPIDSTTGQPSDLCGVCRKVVRKAVHFHEEDLLELEVDIWRAQMGAGHVHERDGCSLTPALPTMDSQ